MRERAEGLLTPANDLKYIDGPKLAAWLDARVEADDPTTKRRLYEWRRGGPASIYAVDNALVRYGYHLSDLPDSFYRADRRGEVSERVYTEALKLYEQGVGPTEISQRLGVCVDTLNKWTREAKLPRQKPRRSPEMKAEALDLYRKGLSPPEIARKLKIGVRTFNRWRLAAGIPARQGWRGKSIVGTKGAGK